MSPLPILYRDEHYIAVSKPPNLLVHRSPISRDETFLLQRLRDQIGRRVYPVHRLDRPTSGVIVFGLNSEAAAALCSEFEGRGVEKRYLAVVRGWTDEQGLIDYPLREEKWMEAQEAQTEYRRLATVRLPIPVGRYPEARYSLLEVRPLTGRYHQIRKHFHHIFHPLVGDTTHGEGRHNRLFREHFAINRLLLHASSLRFRHPYRDEVMLIQAPVSEELQRLFERLGWRGVW